VLLTRGLYIDTILKKRGKVMDTHIVYCDETGDDGHNTSSSNAFILTTIHMSVDSWQNNYNDIKQFRKDLKEEFGFHSGQEMHTKFFLTDKGIYRTYNWSDVERRTILEKFTLMISQLDLSIVNVIIDKTAIKKSDYPVLENALKYNIQRIDNTSGDDWKYIIITDSGRIAPMRKTARAIRVYNPIQSQFYSGYINRPVKNLIEDILDKDSKESYFIQICDFVSYFVHLYFKTQYKKENLPNRVGRLIDDKFVCRVMATLDKGNKFNTKASKSKYGLVIYPK